MCVFQKSKELWQHLYSSSHSWESVEGSEQKGGKQGACDTELTDSTDIHQISNVLLFSLTYVKLQTKNVKVTSRNNYWAKLCLPTDKQVCLTGSICDDEGRAWV